tara:strand:- start:6672 stop:6965 length:294 start_codon:yes stop_codon:yes gene_type:complete
MNEEDMMRIIEEGDNYQLIDSIQENIDDVIFNQILSKEKKYGKVSIRPSRRVFTSYGRSQRMGISRRVNKRKTIRRYTKLQSQGSEPKIHSGRIPSK